MDEIIIIGKNRINTLEPQLTGAMLERHIPEYVLLELDEEQAGLHEQPLEDWVAQIMREYPHTNKDTVRSYLGLKRASFNVAKDYCAQHGAELRIADPNFKYAAETRRRKYLNDSRMLSRPWETLALYAAETPAVMTSAGELVPVTVPEELIKDFRMRDAATEAIARTLDGRVLAFVSIARAFGEYRNLFDRFADEKRVRYDLRDAQLMMLESEFLS